jgi:hypothetical protein
MQFYNVTISWISMINKSKILSINHTLKIIWKLYEEENIFISAFNAENFINIKKGITWQEFVFCCWKIRFLYKI